MRVVCDPALFVTNGPVLVIVLRLTLNDIASSVTLAPKLVVTVILYSVADETVFVPASAGGAEIVRTSPALMAESAMGELNTMVFVPDVVEPSTVSE